MLPPNLAWPLGAGEAGTSFLRVKPSPFLHLPLVPRPFSAQAGVKMHPLRSYSVCQGQLAGSERGGSVGLKSTLEAIWGQPLASGPRQGEALASGEKGICPFLISSSDVTWGRPGVEDRPSGPGHWVGKAQERGRPRWQCELWSLNCERKEQHFTKISKCVK